MKKGFDSHTVVRLVAGISGDKVHEKDLKVKPGVQNFEHDPVFGQNGHQPWVEALFSGDSQQIQKALGRIGVPQADWPQIEATLATIDYNVALSVYANVHTHLAAHSAPAAGPSAAHANAGAASGHTY